VLKLPDDPPVLTPQVETLTDLEGQWWVAHTKPRSEKALAWDLLRRGIGYFLPMCERVTFSGGRKRRVMLPLFTSYLFFCGDDEDHHGAMRTNLICGTIHTVAQARLIEELAAIERALAGDADLAPYPQPAVGQRCRVIAGPFEGIEGIVVQHATGARLILEVGLLGRGAAMEIEADLLELID
jgi:transcriptional antiterminator RfaH